MHSTVAAALDRARSIRFLCSGNVVRSAFAELYARHLQLPIQVDSAATTYRNPSIFPETRAALAEYGVDEELVQRFQPRHLADLADDETDGLLVLGMTPDHLNAWRILHPGRPTAHLLGAALGTPRSIADPVLEDADFPSTFAVVARCVAAIAEHLERSPGRDS